MNSFLQVFYVFFSAILLSLGIPNELYDFGSPFFGLISLIPLYIAYTELKSYKQAFLLGFLHAITVHIISSFWLAYFKDFAALTLGASAIGTGFIGAFLGLAYFLPQSYKTKSIKLRLYSGADSSFLPLRIFWFVSVYVLYEWVKSIGFLGYPWGTVSCTMFRLKCFIQIADITGTYGITFITALFAAISAEGLILLKDAGKNLSVNTYKSYIACFLVLAAFAFSSFLYGTIKYISPILPEKYINVIFVQQNSDPWKLVSDDASILRSQELTNKAIDECRLNGDSIDLVVWSETCLLYRFPQSYTHYKYFPPDSPLIPFIENTNIPFILGGSFKTDDGRIFNSSLLFDNKGNFRGYFPKNHLVPFAEAVPFGNLKPVRDFLHKVIRISAGWTPGDQYVFYDIYGNMGNVKTNPVTKTISLAKTYETQKWEEERPLVKISTPICFDDAFPDVCLPLSNNGTELFINLTDDSWSLKKSSEYQHYVISSFRAIECRTTLARSTNSGFSCVTDPAGRILYSMPLFEAASMFCKIPVYSNKSTVYKKFGNWLPKILLILVLAYSTHFYITIKDKAEPVSERKKLKRFSKKIKKQ